MNKIGGASLQLLVGASALALLLAARHSVLAADVAPSFAAPAGITLVKERAPRNGPGRRGGDATIRLGDEHGMKVYALQDPATSCDQACAKDMKPVLVGQGAVAFGDWAVATSASGAKQWAYKGQLLFTHDGDPPFDDASEAAQDARISANFDEYVASIKDAVTPKDKSAKAKPGEDRATAILNETSPLTADLKIWKLVSYEPIKLATPPDISVAPISNAFGEGLVDHKNMTIYVYRGKKAGSKAPDALWSPVRAPMRAARVGDFTVVSAPDGSSQWAFRGMPLYTYADDLVPGHANGAGEQWQVALTTQYFMPRGVNVAITPIAEVLTVNGQPLYTRNSFIYQLGGHNVRDGLPGGYAVGKKLGTAGCDSECLKEWKPFVAPPDARPSGFWQIAVRSDGTRQWEYKGYVLYTYVRDSQSGDVNGNDMYDLVDGSQPDRYSAAEGGGSVGAALFWHVATP